VYEIEFVKGVLEDMDSLEKETRERVFAVLERIRIDPFRHAKKLSGSDAFRIRVGDFRIVFTIELKKIIIYAVEHRKKVYKF
jgi:mRNA interferase RelE/StbE